MPVFPSAGTISDRSPFFKTIAGTTLILLMLALPSGGIADGSLPGWNRHGADFEHITVEQGLSDGTVLDLLQDRQGFLWFATRDGLNRYDGYGFKVYRHDPGNPNSLSHNEITVIRESKSGDLWIGTKGGGLNRFDRSSERFTRYVHDAADQESLSSNVIQAIHEDRSGALWVGTDAGLNRFDPLLGRFSRYTGNPDDPRSLSDNNIRSVYEDSTGRLWVGTYSGLDEFDRATGQATVRHRHDPKNDQTLTSNYIECMYEDSQGFLWIATRNGLNRLERSTGLIARYMRHPYDKRSLNHDSVRTIHEDSKGTLWIGTDKGLSTLDRATDQFTHYCHDSRNNRSISSNLIEAIAEDRAGALWIGTFGGGVNRLDRFSTRFDRYTSGFSDPENPSSNNITSIYEDRDGILWIGANGNGAIRIERTTGRVTSYRHDPDDPHSLGSDFVTSIIQDFTGAIWVATYRGGLNRLDKDTNRFIRYRHDPDNPSSLSDNDVRTVFVDRLGKLWAGTFRGLDYFDHATKTFVRYQSAPHNIYSLGGSDVRAVYEDLSGLLWVGTTTGGLSLFDRISGIFRRYQHNPNVPGSLIDNEVHTIVQDSGGNLWIGTAGGLDRLNSLSGTFIHFGENDGLPDRNIQGIAEDDDRNLWISTTKGLSRFNMEQGVFTNYDTRDGLQGDKFNGQSVLRSTWGELFFGGPYGLNVFLPGSIADNHHIPPVVLTDFRIFNNPAPPGIEGSPLKRSINETDRIVLSHGQSDFSVAFAALNYRAPDRNRYAYRLEGFDADWIFTDSSHRRASYSGLKEGTYRFLVKASNNDGLWNEEGTALGIVIAPPWWRSVWFNGLAAMMTAGLLFAAYRWRIASMKKRNRDLETLVSLRTREIAESLDHLAQARNQAEAARQQAEKASKTKSIFLANMSHELRTPLNSILGYAQILRGRAASDDSLVEGLAAIRQSGDHLLTLINDILDIAKIEAGKIDLLPAPTYLPGFIDGIVNLIKNRAEAKDLSLTYEPRPPLPSGVMVDEKRLRQVLVNLLGNAVKFTERGGVGLIVERLDSPDQRTGPPTATLRFTVEDTGIGIPPLELEGLFRPFVQVGHADKQIEGAGLGLTISQQIVTLMDSRIRVKSEPGKGSAFWFEVTLPVVEIAVEEQTAQRRMPTGYEGPRRKVLVVDDKRYHRFILEAMLAPLGFEISTANDGQQAVDKALAERPDVILMDLVMPVKTGLEAIQEIRRNADMEDVVIIAVSASVMEIDRAKSQVAGCNAFLPKPVRIEDLTVLMGKHMGLNWIYGKPEQETDSAEKASVKQLVPLPPEEMEALHELIKAGKLRQFRDRLAALEETDEQSRPFIQRLQSMARGYEIKRIMTVLQREREGKQ